MANEQNLIPVKSGKEARELGRKGGLKSVQVRRERARLRKLGYTGVESFDELVKLQKAALDTGNINGAIKAEELKGKLAGLYVDKVAATNSEGNDINIPIVSSQELLSIMERRRDERKRT